MAAPGRCRCCKPKNAREEAQRRAYEAIGSKWCQKVIEASIAKRLKKR